MISNVTVSLKCSYCGESFLDKTHILDGNPGIKLRVKAQNTNTLIWLSSVLGSTTMETEVQVPEGEIVTFSCPNCSADLTTSQTCDVCGAPLALLKISDGGKIRVCCRTGCPNVWLDL